MISTDPLAPGSVYAASVDDQGKVGLYRIEVGCSPGTGKLKIAGGVEGPMKESIQRAFAYLMGQKVKMGIGQQMDTTDFHVEAIDLLSNRVPCEAGIALVVAIYSAVKKHSVLAGLVILGDLSIQGNIKSVRSLAEPLQVGMDNGARRALIPLENKRNFLEVSGDIVERVDPVFFSDPMTAAMKALGDDVTMHDPPIREPDEIRQDCAQSCGRCRLVLTSRQSSAACSGKTGPRHGWSRWSSPRTGTCSGDATARDRSEPSWAHLKTSSRTSTVLRQ